MKIAGLLSGAMNRFKLSKAGSTVRLGLEVGADRVAAVVIEPATGRVVQDFFWPLDNLTPVADQLHSHIQSASLQGACCQLVLTPEDYKLLLVEAPRVEPDEMRDAVRWRIRDLVDVAVDDISLDVFPLPPDSSRSGQPMLYAAVCERQRLQVLIETIKAAGLQLQTIDIGELAIRNLLQHEGYQDRSVAVARLEAGQGQLMLFRQGYLYLARRFDLAYGGGLFDELPDDQLALEIQRSFDYYERQMGQVPPAHLLLCGENLTPEKISQPLRSSLSADISCLAAAGAADAVLQGAGLVAMGAALRGIAVGS